MGAGGEGKIGGGCLNGADLVGMRKSPSKSGATHSHSPRCSCTDSCEGVSDWCSFLFRCGMVGAQMSVVPFCLLQDFVTRTHSRSESP